MRRAISLFRIPPESIIEVFPEATDFIDLRAGQLSGGWLRIFEILLILNSQAPFCLLDEPFTGLTPVFIERIKRILREAKYSKGILVTDHMHKHIEEIADRLYLLVNGQTYPIRDRDQLITLGYLNHL
jgi:ABC-type branched-subunit amino acid transport system ATPase component